MVGLVRAKRFSEIANFILAVIVAFGTLIGLSVTIIVKSPACLEFWEKSPIYQVYPRSFKDCDAEEWPDRVAESKDNPDRPNICGDGIGDLLGLIQKLDYLDELGIKVIWINPIYLSPQRDFGYDVSDYYHIDPQFGTDEDIELLIVEMHKRGMKLLMDFVPNHTSIEHKLFTDSVNRTVGSEDNYIWVDGDKPEGCALIETEGIDKGLPNEACSSCADNCPNNWQSVFAKNDKTILPAWTYHPVRDQYYYRAFSSFQPDLNLRNPAVEEELQNIIAYWLDKGVDGFRVDAVGYAYENEDLRNEVKKDESEAGYWSNLYHDFTYEVGTFHDLLLGFRKVMESYSTEPGVERMMITEATSFRTVADLMRYYGIYGQNEADFPMNFGLMELGMFGNDGSVNSELINKTISDWMEAMPEGRVPNWIISSHDESRILSRHADLKLDKENQKRLAKSFALLLMTLPGTPFVYYGQELGMIDLTPEDHPTECQVDVQEDSRDKNRSPMRWNSTAQYAGFSDCSASPEQSGSCPSCPWLPVGADQTFYDIQEKDKESVFKYYQWLIKDIRLQDEFTRGQFCLSANKNYKPEDQLQNYFR